MLDEKKCVLEMGLDEDKKAEWCPLKEVLTLVEEVKDNDYENDR